MSEFSEGLISAQKVVDDLIKHKDNAYVWYYEREIILALAQEIRRLARELEEVKDKVYERSGEDG